MSCAKGKNKVKKVQGNFLCSCLATFRNKYTLPFDIKFYWQCKNLKCQLSPPLPNNTLTVFCVICCIAIYQPHAQTTHG